MTPDLEQMTKYAVLLESHGHEMEVGGRLKKKFDANPIQRVSYRIAHPAAVAVGERFLGTHEIMTGHYPGDPDGDPEDQAAYGNFQWVNRLKPQVVFDIHENTYKGQSFFAVGPIATIMAIEAGKLLSDKCNVVDCSFFDAIPIANAFENSLADKNPEDSAEIIYSGIRRLAENGSRLVSYEKAISGITFYQRFEIPTAGANGQLRSGIKHLEAIEDAPSFLPLELNDIQRQVLSLPPEAQVSRATWGHSNMSRLVPEKFGYTASGIPRREFFGAYMVQIAPPVPTIDGFVVFQKETRPLVRKPKGLLQLAA